MGSSAKLRTIYYELRRALGSQVAAGELLRLACIILKFSKKDFDPSDDFGQTRQGRTLLALPLDEAMSDGGWKILDFECHRGFDVEELESKDLIYMKTHFRRLLGPQWHQRFPED